MDLESIEKRLESGESLKIKYRYPIQNEEKNNSGFGVRSDKLVDVSFEKMRLYTNFRENTPIWLNIDEVVEITLDDGIYDEF